MTLYHFLLMTLAATAGAVPSTVPKDLVGRRYFAVELDPAQHPDPLQFAVREAGGGAAGWRFEEPLSVPHHYLFSVPRASRMKMKRSGMPGMLSLEEMEPRQLYKRALPRPSVLDSGAARLYDLVEAMDIDDPIFPEQWHLLNAVQPGHDINVTGAWAQNVTGRGVHVCVVDDGLDVDSKDLAANFFADGSWDFNDPGPLPKPRLSDDRHGTRCAGEIAAVKNDACGLGVAFGAQVAGVRILSKRILPSDEALAINFAMDKNDIYSCSWGPSDNGRTMEAPPEIVKKAMLHAVQKGREEKGSVYVFASGNGGGLEDNCNFDGYTNSIYSITVGAIDRKGLHPAYSESCSANMVVTYSSGSGDYIHTTDVHGQCARTHGGTSAAAPIAAGVFALVLEANPELTWRDVQYLAWETAVRVNEEEAGWQATPAGKWFHHAYGYGKLDAFAIVERARGWKNVKPQAWHFVGTQREDAEIGKKREFTVSVSEEDMKRSNVERLEHVQVHVNAGSSRRGGLKMTLVSPSGVESEIMTLRRMDGSEDGVAEWNFMSVAHWGERGVGEWKLRVEHGMDGVESVLKDWRLMLWGEAVDAGKAREFSLGELEEGSEVSTTKGATEGSEVPTTEGSEVSTTGVSEVSTTEGSEVSTTGASEIPTTGASEISTTGVSEISTTGASEISTTGASEIPTTKVPEVSEKPTPTSEPETSTSTAKETGASSSIIPTFGMSKNTAAWVYGSGLIILAFVAGVSGYLCYIRRRRRGGQGYKGFNLLNSGARGDEELGEELESLTHEFSLSDEEEEEEEEEPEQEEEEEEKRVGKKAVDLYKVES